MVKKQTRLKRQASSFPVPQGPAEANGHIERIGAAQRARELIQTAMNEALAETKARFEAEAAPLKAEIEGLARGLQTWAAANRERLTAGGKRKFAKFAAGELAWRLRPPKVSIRGTDAVIAALRAAKLGRFLRTKIEIDKEAMLKQPEVAGAVKGVTIGSDGEDFVIKPFETELDEVVG